MTSKIVVNNIESDSGIGSVTFTSNIELGTKNLKGHNLESTGIITATTFSGSGANLTSIPAAQLTGTVADARISTLTASKLSGALPAISGANLTGLSAGITMADQHRIPSLFTMATSDTVLTNFERVDSDGAGTLGTGMSVSSGIFTFPSTGIYLIHYFFTPYSNSGSDTNQVQIALQTTTDNGTYGNAAYAVGSLDYQYDR